MCLNQIGVGFALCLFSVFVCVGGVIVVMLVKLVLICDIVVHFVIGVVVVAGVVFIVRVLVLVSVK